MLVRLGFVAITLLLKSDSSFRPSSHRPNNTDWPTIVIESGVSETLRHLRFDADWWLRKSGGSRHHCSKSGTTRGKDGKVGAPPNSWKAYNTQTAALQ